MDERECVGNNREVVTDKSAHAVAVGHGKLNEVSECPCHGITASLEISFLSLCRAHDAGGISRATEGFSAMIVFMSSSFFDTLDFILDSVADTGLHFHALARFLLRLLLLLLLAGVLRVGLTFLQRLSQILCSLVGLAIVVHRHLRAAPRWTEQPAVHCQGRVVAVRASLLRVELDIHRGMEALLVGHVLQLHGFTRHIVGFLLVGEAHAAPFADGADAAVLVRPRVAALLLLGLCGIFPALRLTFRCVAFGFLCLCGTGRLAGSRHELHAALLHVHLQGGDELSAVVALDDELVAYGQSGAGACPAPAW